MAKEDFSKELRKLAAKLEGELDQRLAELRGEYESLDKADRKQFTGWLRKIIAAEPPKISMYVSARVEVLIQKSEDQVDAVRVSARSLLNATEAWDKRKGYRPRAMRDS